MKENYKVFLRRKAHFLHEDNTIFKLLKKKTTIEVQFTSPHTLQIKV